MDDQIARSAASREGHLAMRRVERQQLLIELLHSRSPESVQLAELGERLQVSTRTVARDVERLITAGLPIETRQGPSGGVRLQASTADGAAVVTLDVAEVAALISSLAVTGTTNSLSAASAMRKLRESLG